MIVDHGVEQVISTGKPEWVPVFTGLSVGQFRKLVRVVVSRGGAAVADGRPGRQWGLPLADRVLLVAVYYRTNLTLRQVAPLFGVSKSAAGRVVDELAPLLTLTPVTRKHGPDTVLIVGGYRGNPGVIVPYRKPAEGQPPLPQWKQDRNKIHKRVRARVEHALAHLKSWNILRNCRRKRDGVYYATSGVALMRNLAMTT